MFRWNGWTESVAICTFNKRGIGNLRKLIEEDSNECENKVVSGRNHRTGLCKHLLVDDPGELRDLMLAGCLNPFN